jgi:hypothetical protein
MAGERAVRVTRSAQFSGDLSTRRGAVRGLILLWFWGDHLRWRALRVVRRLGGIERG